MKALYLRDEDSFLRWVEVPGTNPALIWLHGVWCSSTGELAAAAVQEPLHGRRSLLVDLLGYGYSDRPAEFGYRVEDHSRTITALVDSLVGKCVLVGHSMGGTVATQVAAARPERVAALILAEANLTAGPGLISGQVVEHSEQEFVETALNAILADQRRGAIESGGIGGAHVGITQLIDPRTLHRAATALVAGTHPSTRSVLSTLALPRYYLAGAWSDSPDVAPDAELVQAGVKWRTVPDAGHPMALQNPAGFAAVIAEILDEIGL